ncbi:hypothetical protein HK414_16115 [Ramlibacter terrae]|uniref:Uncharacterized protein n=1 Tax=Ramlibacter terrae TaxID=2732511 RepID=A0ABX6P3P4_9BURK|nr:hypothetical protein HK414_16115 [Ramlibacter terrae]
MQAALLAATTSGGGLLSQHGDISVTEVDGAYLVAFGGGFAGRDISNLQVAVALDASGPSGSFTIEHDGETTQAIAYAADATTMAGNIRAALEALDSIGAGNVLVAALASAPGSQLANFSVTFRGELAGRDIADFTTDFSGR